MMIDERIIIKKLKRTWRKTNVLEKISFVVVVACAIALPIIGISHLAKVEKIVPPVFTGWTVVMMLAFGLLNWRNNRKAAKACLWTALFAALVTVLTIFLFVL